MTPFCAICTETVTEPIRRAPLGRNDAMVIVCVDCDSARPRERGPSNYVPTFDEGMNQVTMAKKMGAELARVAPAGEAIARHAGRNETAKTRTPGCLIIRIRRRHPGGGARDAREAFEAELADKPWAKEVRYVGADIRWHIYERPDPEVAAQQRAPSDRPLMWLEQYRSGEGER